MSFDYLVAQINTASETQRDRGTYFEYLAQAYFQNEPTYKNEFKNVWMLSDVPAEFGIPKEFISRFSVERSSFDAVDMRTN